MFDYTIVAIEKTIKDIKKVNNIFSILAQLTYIAYLLYALITDTGVFLLNSFVMVISMAYFFYFIALLSKEKEEDLTEQEVNSQNKKLQFIRKFYKYTKHFVKLFAIILAVSDLIVEKSEATAVAILFTALMIIAFVLQLFFDAIIYIITDRFKFFKEAMVADYNNAIKPIKKVSNFVKRLKGEDIAEPEPPTKHKLILDKLVSIRRNEKEKKKAEEKEMQKAEQKTLREAKIAEKKSRGKSNVLKSLLSKVSRKDKHTDEKTNERVQDLPQLTNGDDSSQTVVSDTSHHEGVTK